MPKKKKKVICEHRHLTSQGKNYILEAVSRRQQNKIQLNSFAKCSSRTWNKMICQEDPMRSQYWTKRVVRGLESNLFILQLRKRMLRKRNNVSKITTKIRSDSLLKHNALPHHVCLNNPWVLYRPQSRIQLLGRATELRFLPALTCRKMLFKISELLTIKITLNHPD
jgi:hypothetical protein